MYKKPTRVGHSMGPPDELTPGRGAMGGDGPSPMGYPAQDEDSHEPSQTPARPPRSGSIRAPGA